MEDEKEYIKGFNQGYLFKQHKPLLFDTVSKGLINESSYRDGFFDGGKEYDLERGRELLRERNIGAENEPDNNRDR